MAFDALDCFNSFSVDGSYTTNVCPYWNCNLARTYRHTQKNYPKPILYLMLVFSFPAIVMNIGADIAGMGAVGNLLFPAIEASYFSFIFTILLLILIVYLPYHKIAAILKYLCIALLVYLIVPFLYHQDWMKVLKATVIPTIHFNKEYIGILVGILGTTISPYLFFWQASMEVEEMKHKKNI